MSNNYNINHIIALYTWYKDRGLEDYCQNILTFDVVFVEDIYYQSLSIYPSCVQMLEKIYKAMNLKSHILHIIGCTNIYGLYNVIMPKSIVLLGHKTLEKFNSIFASNLKFGELNKFKISPKMFSWIVATYHPYDMIQNVNLKQQTWMHLRQVMQLFDVHNYK